LLPLLHEPPLSPASFALPPSGVILAKMPGFSSALQLNAALPLSLAAGGSFAPL
jgi:hypothetical protein